MITVMCEADEEWRRVHPDCMDPLAVRAALERVLLVGRWQQKSSNVDFVSYGSGMVTAARDAARSLGIELEEPTQEEIRWYMKGEPMRKAEQEMVRAHDSYCNVEALLAEYPEPRAEGSR